MALDPEHWRVSLAARPEEEALLLACLEAFDAPEPFAVMASEAEPGVRRLEALFAEEPDAAALEAALARGLEAPPPALVLDLVPPRDWVLVSQDRLPAVRVGRVVLYGRHAARAFPPNLVALEIEAGEAFGTGHHETTRLCLAALQDRLRKSRPRKILDLGCGTAVLALAAARLTSAAVTASDIDPVAIATARENCRKAGLGPRVRLLAAKGLAPAVAARGPFDLVLANILARPLVAMMTGLSRALAPGAALILSGLLAEQERALAARARAAGLVRTHMMREGEWIALVFEKPQRKAPRRDE
ncbi:MAG: 50S ribosomal protein L11 methyltransferase [Alphaproteobacteria bacterium]|nr:50S ribosomal protein L11 methyltransferase [Alphaproteobacteria bacterium]